MLIQNREITHPVGRGALAPFDTGIAEIRRMYVHPGHRRRGVARRVLRALERRAVVSGLDSLILETGIRQPEALALYEAEGYERTEPFGKYAGNPYPVCLIKKPVPGR